MSGRDNPSAKDHELVATLLGRVPQGDFTVAVRHRDGTPVVLRNAPLLHDGTPMPTLYWLLGPQEVTAVSRLESAGTIDAVENELGLEAIALIHARYERERDADVPSDYDGPRPSGGVGGTRTGVKCLHAHFAYWLAGGDDAVGAWTAQQFKDQGLLLTERVNSI